jgi:hypothetical protein
MQAVLLAYRSEEARPQAPPIYEEAGRIRQDLLGPLPGAETEAEPETAEPAAPPAAGTPTSTPPPTRGKAATQQPTVLRPSDLDRSKVTGQAAPAGRLPSRSRTVPQVPPAPALRQWTRPEPTFEEGSTENVPEEGGEVPQVLTPPPAGVYYRPGIQSTGRLHLEVGPTRGKRTERG